MKWLLTLILLFSSLRMMAGDWVFASGKVQFSIKNAGLMVEGHFPDLKAIVKLNPKCLSETQLEGSVTVKTIETGIQLRNQHLKKEAYFHAEKYPEMAMKLLHLETSHNGWKGEFLVKIKGVSQKMINPVEFLEKENSARISTQFKINRRDFGVGGSSWTMADEVQVSIPFLLKPA